MIDLHCHLLPGIDDGPKTTEDAVAMCKRAVANGITHAVATPHITPGRYDNTLESIQDTFERFVAELNDAEVPLQLSFAAEVRLDPLILSLVETDTLPILGYQDDEPVMLLEFPHTHIPPGAEELVQWLREKGIRPLIAHPERNRAVMDDWRKIGPYVKAGCLLQVTAGALTGVFGDSPAKTAKRLLKKGWVSILASDAHNLHARQPELAAGRAAAARLIGEEAAWSLVRTTPAKLCQHHFEAV